MINSTAQNTLLYKASGQRKSVDLLIAVPFILFFLIQLAHHQMWRDELNAWGVAVGSPNPAALFHNIHYEAHPSLWYLLLWLASRFTAAPAAMKVVEAAVGVSIYLMIASRSPFARREKVLLFLSYFISFEYTVFARMYGLCLLLLLLYLHCRVTRPRQVMSNAALLGVLANADTMGMILSFALLVEYGFERLQHGRESVDGGRKQIYLAALLYFVLVGISIWTLRPAGDLSWRTTDRMFAYAFKREHLYEAIRYYLVMMWWPINPEWPEHWWNVSHNFRTIYLAPVVLGVYYWIFRRDWNLLFLIGVNAAAIVTFAHLIYLGSIRHYGVTFLAFLAALWIQQSRRVRISMWATVLLAISAGSGVLAAIAQWNHPFSNAKAAADWLREHHLQQAVLVGTEDTSVTGVAQYLQRSMYFLDCSCTDRFVLYAKRRDSYRREQLAQRVELAARQLHAPEMILILDYSLTEDEKTSLGQRSLRVTPLTQFTGAEMWGEDFYLYKISKIPPSGVQAGKSGSTV